VVVSRSELIEIGGAFRLPEVLARSGATLVEVGTTNKTRLSDFAQAIGPETGVLLKVHPSNYVVCGFTEQPSLEELVELGRRHGVPVIDDIGSGAIDDFSSYGLRDEPTAKESLRAGADVCLFSGDKLLGGPQCGIIVGKKELLAKIGSHPLMRALRVDKMTLAALAATLDQTARRKLGHSLAIRQVDAGSCNGCELEIHALNNAFHDLERFGLHFVASPRHADVLLVTGPVTHNMHEALRLTYEATPGPKWVVACGDCAKDGGCFKGSYAVAGGVSAMIPVDLHIPGCPPPPLAILRGLLALLDRAAAG